MNEFCEWKSHMSSQLINLCHIHSTFKLVNNSSSELTKYEWKAVMHQICKPSIKMDSVIRGFVMRNVNIEMYWFNQHKIHIQTMKFKWSAFSRYSHNVTTQTIMNIYHTWVFKLLTVVFSLQRGNSDFLRKIVCDNVNFVDESVLFEVKSIQFDRHVHKIHMTNT